MYIYIIKQRYILSPYLCRLMLLYLDICCLYIYGYLYNYLQKRIKRNNNTLIQIINTYELVIYVQKITSLLQYTHP